MKRDRKLQVRVVSPWFGQLETDEVFFSSQLSQHEADALLCDWAPSEELFDFPRRKAWYCCEPQSQFKTVGGSVWASVKTQLGAGEFLCHNHPDPAFRVPHVTHFQNLAVRLGESRAHRAIAVVSNQGGSPRTRHPGISYRNRFVTSSKVDLFGRESWRQYRANLFSRAAAPSNYRGEIPGDWPATAKRDLLARYKVAVSLENMNEDNYFTEKFVEAVCAGCIPVYKPDAATADTVLANAFWVDPTAHGDDPDTVIEFALSLNLEAAQAQHAEWIVSNQWLAASSHSAVFARIARILSANG